VRSRTATPFFWMICALRAAICSPSTTVSSLPLRTFGKLAFCRSSVVKARMVPTCEENEAGEALRFSVRLFVRHFDPRTLNPSCH